jgi:subtilase family serine protease
MTRRTRLAGAALALLFGATAYSAPGTAAALAPTRLSGPIDAGVRAAMAGSVDGRVAGSVDLGGMDSTAVIGGVSLYFKPSAAQQAQLDALLAAQQTPGSPAFHAWLTPEQYGARFGMSDADLAKVSAWLRAQGLSVREISRARNRLVVDGTVAQLQNALGTSLHRFQLEGESHFANAEPLQLPAALSGVVLGVRNLNDFRLKPRVRRSAVVPEFTSGITGNHYLAPGDIVTIYDIQPLYTAGLTGSGRKIAIVGQSAINTSDMLAFRSASGLSATVPTVTLMPNTGASAVSGTDVDEASLDLEWSGAIAQDAALIYVYTGNNPNYGVVDALQYAIDNDIAPVVSISYGICEIGQATEAHMIQLWAQQANAQGQTVIAASGDGGAADCDASNSVASHGLAVDLPASVPEVTGVGGTEFSADIASPATYWAASNSAGNASALSYIPETVWNDSAAVGSLDASGGGVSTIFAKPAWQAGTGVSNDGARDVPDISLDAANAHDPYLYCVNGSCVTGFRAANSELTVAGGTSFAAPVFAGVLTLLEQAVNADGVGNFNPTLYAQAANAATYATAFHDITTGNNKVPCTIGSTGCGLATGGQIGYSAGVGYDLATGLGSIDVAVTAGFLPNSATGVIDTSTTVSPPAGNVGVDSAATFTATLTLHNTGSAPLTGTVQFQVGGADYGAPVALTGTQATQSITFPARGNYAVAASFSGDASYSASSGSVDVAVQGIATSLAVSDSGATLAAGSPASFTATLNVARTIATGPSGTVQFQVDGANAGSAVPLSGTQAGASLTIATAGNHTVSASYAGDTVYLPSTAPAASVSVAAPAASSGNSGGGGAAAPLLLLALAGLAEARRRRKLRARRA